MDNQGKIYFNIGRFLFGFVMLYLAVEAFALCNSLDKDVPFYIGFGKFWVIVMGIVYAIAGISYISNKATGIMALIVTLMVIIIIFSSTIRGFYLPGNPAGTILKVTGHLVVIAGSLMIASNGDMVKAFNWGKWIFGIYFLAAGVLHFMNAGYDARLLPGFSDAKGLVIFTGVCWVACGISMWINIMSRLAALGAIVLIIIITFMINTKSGIDSWHVVSQIFSNLAAIAACLLVAGRGRWFFTLDKGQKAARANQ